MPSSSARKAMAERADKELFENVASPFCGTLPDDLTVERTDKGLKVVNNACGQSVAGFERKLPPSSPQVAGKVVDLATAVKHAAKLVGKAKLPLYGGLATDVEGMRAVLALAERSGGVVDHALSEVQYRNFKIVQSTGWIMSTLTEVRNRADFIIIAGSDIHKLHPRFFERIVSPPDSMFDVTAPKRIVVFIGKGLDRSGAKGSRIGEVITLACDNEQAGDVVALLRARLRGFDVKPPKSCGVKLAEINALGELCREFDFLLCADEVKTGFGRAGTMFAVERFGVEPDLLALGKSMGGGVMPIGALLGTESSMDFDDVSTGSTWSWLPAACAAALATLDVFEQEPILENVMALEAAGLQALRGLMDNYEAIGDVRVTGCFMAIEFVKDRETKERDLDLQERVAWGCVRRGLLIDPSTTSLNIQPSLVMPVEELATVFGILDESIAEALSA